MYAVPAPITRAELDAALAIRDLSDPAAGPHAIQAIVDEIKRALAAAWPSEFRVRRDHPVVSLADNYDDLGYAAGAVTRDARYTRYVDAEHVLRSHSSAMVPPALRQLATEQDHDDVLLVCPGICYRRDSVDWQHTGTPQQLDLWRITRNRRCDGDGLLAMIRLVVEAVLPGAEWRAVPAVHPYTVGGRQIDVHWNNEWIEIGECGVAAPEVLRRAGLDTGLDARLRNGWSGLAMGLGLDRLLMLRKGIPDIRLLRSSDPRVEDQLGDLSAYRTVSQLPPVRRDLSVVVDAGTDLTAEALGDRVRAALGPDADAAELVEARTVTPYDDLPAPARDRLGIEPGQLNLLLRLVLRPVDRTLTDAEANELRDQVYAELHRGAVAQWAGVRATPTAV